MQCVSVNLPEWTTAWVCSEVPEAMLVRAQAASNWREGLQKWWEHSECDLASMSSQSMIHLF